MKLFIAVSLLLTAAAGAPNSGGGQHLQLEIPSYTQLLTYSAPETQSFSGPNQQYNSQPVEFRTPQVSFTPPQIAYSQPGVTYSQPQLVSVPQPQHKYVNPPAFIPSPYASNPVIMGYRAAPSSY